MNNNYQFLTQKVQKDKEHYQIQWKKLQDIAVRCQDLLNIIVDYYQLIQQQIQNINKEIESIDAFISELREDSPIQQDFQQIYETNFNKKQSIEDSKFLNNPLQNIDEKLALLKNIITDYLDYWTKTISQDDLNQINSLVKQIDYTNNYYYASDISNNEQLLAYGGSDKILKIYDIKKQEVIKDLKVGECIYVCQFTIDSSQLFIGCSSGYVFAYDALKDFKEIFRQQIHKNSVFNIRAISNQNLITCSADKTIIKTDIKSKQKIFKLIGHTNYIIAMDYNEKDDLIISGSNDKSIKIWDCKSQSIVVDKQLSHQSAIRQIQLINNNQNILSLDNDNNLYKWKIDLINKDLIKIQEFNDPNKILSFYQINQDQNLLLICGGYIKILNEQAVSINKIDYEPGYYLINHYESRQHDNGRFIHIRSGGKIILVMVQK